MYVLADGVEYSRVIWFCKIRIHEPCRYSVLKNRIKLDAFEREGMESGGADGIKSSELEAGLWWRWTHGTSGLTASSSQISSLHDLNHHTCVNTTKIAAKTAPGSAVRCPKRSSRVLSTDNSANDLTWSRSSDAAPLFSVSTATHSSRIKAVCIKKKTMLSSSVSSRGLLNHSSNQASLKESLSSSPCMPSEREEKHANGSESSWSVTKRPIFHQKKRNAKSSSSQVTHGRAPRSAGPRTARFLHTTDIKAPNPEASVSAFSDLPLSQTLALDRDETLPRSTKPSSLPTSSSAISAALASSFSIKRQAYSTIDPLVHCARAILQDCIRNRRKEESSARKRSIETCNRLDVLETKAFAWPCDEVSKNRIMSSGSSSSSDEELSQLLSMDPLFGVEKADNRVASKLAKEEIYRQILQGDCGLSSSPDFQCLSPMAEVKGLPIEVRYQLPLALGTANEISKECTICQHCYGIGDHIVTLPCQHFFHACCVDKWLWNHTSCPLCRAEVYMDQETETQSTKHNFTECSLVDQERIRRQMRSSSQLGDFRPVVPEELELTVSCLTIEDDSDAEDESNSFICPTPHFATNTRDGFREN
ncbi:hypothetical protein CCR75_004179 [Bremia lactucae]|uniref:RING-type E3 ubiquitin transferase n=1 Tax=Bremia lactucae TaxID=4779 RepID=A0A976FL93_BRELC|nr:hypothetical protein CCR75_004179 [Bremia lactucae]